MNYLKYILVVVGLFVFVSVDAQIKDANAVKYGETITAGELNEHLTILAADAYEGRETGEKGEQMAADYLVEQFAADGIEPVIGDSYFQKFSLEKYKPEGGATVYGKTFVYMKDFVFFHASGEEFQIDEMLFCGYGIESDKYNDYKSLDVKGKDLIVLGGEPVDEDGNSYVSGEDYKIKTESDIFSKMNLAEKKGAKRLFIVYDDYEKRIAPYEHFFSGMKMMKVEDTQLHRHIVYLIQQNNEGTYARVYPRQHSNLWRLRWLAQCHINNTQTMETCTIHLTCYCAYINSYNHMASSDSSSLH